MEAASTVSPCDKSRKKPSQIVVDRIAELEESSPVDLPPLFSAIDPDALDALFCSRATEDSRSPGHVRFSYSGYDVRVRGDGDVSVTES